MLRVGFVREQVVTLAAVLDGQVEPAYELDVQLTGSCCHLQPTRRRVVIGQGHNTETGGLGRSDQVPRIVRAVRPTRMRVQVDHRQGPPISSNWPAWACVARVRAWTTWGDDDMGEPFETSPDAGSDANAVILPPHGVEYSHHGSRGARRTSRRCHILSEE